MTANPTLLSMPLAQNGQKNVIPETQVTAGDGLFSQSTGFPAETSLPLGAGGVAPSREDFNGMANLLGGVAYYAQKGFTFNYDAAQDYYTGCIVIDPNDGNRYLCIADMAAGTVAPHSDTANTYWKLYKMGLEREQIPAFNKVDKITTSGTYTVTVTGWHRITVKGGGGGGQGGKNDTSVQLAVGGRGGGEAGTTIVYKKLSNGDNVSVVIGAGGAGGGGGGNNGNDGGSSSVIVDGTTYTAYGGKSSTSGGAGGVGTIQGACGGPGMSFGKGASYGGEGGGQGGGYSASGAAGTAGIDGCGGGGGYANYTGGLQYAGGAGGNGYATFEYFAEV